MTRSILLIAALFATCLTGCDRDPYMKLHTVADYEYYLTHDDAGRYTGNPYDGYSGPPLMFMQRSFTDCSSHVYIDQLITSCEQW